MRDSPSPRSASLPKVLRFMQLLWAVVHGMDTQSKRMARDIGVTGPQRLVLRLVGLRPGLSAGELAALIHVHPSTLTGILKRLVEQGLLARVEDAHDRRRAVLRLTASGKRVNAITRGTVEQAISRALDDVPQREHGAAARLLARIARGLNR